MESDVAGLATHLTGLKTKHDVKFPKESFLYVGGYNKDDSTALRNVNVVINKYIDPEAIQKEIAALRARIAELEAMENENVNHPTPPYVGSRADWVRRRIMLMLCDQGGTDIADQYYRDYYFNEPPAQNLADSVANHILTIDRYSKVWDYGLKGPALRKGRDEILIPYMNEFGNELIALRKRLAQLLELQLSGI